MMRASQARKLLALEERCATLKAELEAAECERNTWREKLREDVIASNGVLSGGVKLMCTPVAGRETFDLKAYRQRYGISARMEPYIKQGGGFDRWTVKRG